MINEFAHTMETWLRLLLVPTSKAALLAIIAALLTFGLRRWIAPRWRHLLWAMVFVRLVLPDLGEWQWSAQALIEPVQTTAEAPAPTRTRGLTAPSVDEPAAARPQPPMRRQLIVPQVRKAALPPVTPPLSAMQWAALIWALGAAVVLGIMAACAWRFHRKVLVGAEPAGESWQELLAQLVAPRRWLPAPAVLQSSQIAGPLLAGLWSPRIVLPADLGALSVEQKRHLLQHELAHWRRADLWVLTASSLLLALHWFNPLLWFAHRRLRLEAEACADASVLQTRDQTDARDYGSTLLKFATASASVLAVLLTPGILGMAGSGNELRERLTEIADGQRRKRWWTWLAVLLVVLAAVACFTRPLLSGTGSVEGQVVDERDQPVSNVTVALRVEKASASDRGITRISDIAGRFRFENQNPGAKLQLIAHAPPEEYEFAAATTTVGDGQPVKLVLKDPRRLEGIITAADGKPVMNARVYESNGSTFLPRAGSYDGVKWNENDCALSDDSGRYRLPLTKYNAKRLIRIESATHATFFGEIPEIKAAKTTFDAVLSPLPTPGQIEGTVLDVEGQPLKGALTGVAEGSFYSMNTFDADWIEKRSVRRGSSFETMINAEVSVESGKFTLKAVPEVVAEKAFVVAVHPSGIVRMPLAKFLEYPILRLEPWNTVKVQFVTPDGKPMAVTKVRLSTKGGDDSLSLPEADARPRPLSSQPVYLSTYGVTDADGRFTFSQVLPHSQVSLGCGNDSSQTVGEVFNIGVGETKELTVKVIVGKESAPLAKSAEKAQDQRRVVGELVAPPGVKVQFSRVLITVSSRPVGKGSGTALCDASGRFIIAGLRPDTYALNALISPRDFDLITMEFSMPADPTQQDFDLGKLQLTAKEKSPSFALPKGPTGTVRFKVQDEAGHPVQGAEVSATLRGTDPSPNVVYDSIFRLNPVFTDAKGEAALTFQRDMPNRVPTAALLPRVKKSGFVSPIVKAAGNGETVTVTLMAAPGLSVSGLPANADLWATSKRLGSMLTQLTSMNGVASAALPEIGTFSCMLTDRSDPEHWRISALQVIDFQPGKTHEWQGTWEPGVIVQGRVSKIATPIQGEAWAEAQVSIAEPISPGEIRSAHRDDAARTVWKAWCPVSPSGDFLFPGVPRGQLKITVVGPGWFATEPPRLSSERSLTSADDVIKLELIGNRLNKLEIRVLAPDGSPAVGAEVAITSMSQGNLAYRSNVPTAIVANAHQSAYDRWLNQTPPGQNATTDAAGLALIENQHVGTSRGRLVWTDAKTGEQHRRSLIIPIGPADREPFVIDLSKPAPQRTRVLSPPR